MANGHVEIHDPFANSNELTSPTASMDDSVEFRLLMVYAQRRRPPAAPELDSPGQTDPPSPPTTQNDKGVKEEKKKKKRRGARRVLRMFSCIKPSVKSDEPSEPAPPPPEPEFKCGVVTAGETLTRLLGFLLLPVTLKPCFRRV